MKTPTLAAVAAALVTALTTWALPAPAATADPTPPVTVTWPEVTQFNPANTSYEVTVSDAGTDPLVAWWQGVPQELPHEGTAALTFGTDGTGTVAIARCPAGYTDLADCTEVARSAQLGVYTAMHVFGWDTARDYLHSGPATGQVIYQPAVPDLVTTWQLVDDPAAPQHVYASGTLPAAPVTDPASGISDFEFTVPDALPSGDYYLSVHMAAETSEYGHLEGDSDPDILVHVDNDAPVLKVRRLVPVLYPARDGYRDYLDIQATTDGLTTGVLEVRNAAGDLMVRKSGLRVAEEHQYYDGVGWDGRTSRGRLVPAGRYTVSLRVADAAGNTTGWAGTVTVSHQRLTWTTFHRTVTAAASRVGKPLVGRCSSLAAPAAGGPRGSLGFYSQTRCVGSGAENVVATSHGMYIPKAFENHYRWVQVTAHGGPATAAPRNYLVMGYVDPRTNRLVNDTTLTGGVGAHPGARSGPGVIFDLKTNRPYLLWSVGLGAGSRYNVSGFTVEVAYQTLQ